MADLYTEARKRAEESVDEQAILDKYNAATIAQYNAQREQNRINENKFYNQMYNTQRTAMDTIRQSNAAAVATGASRGVQAAQELSSLLGLQQESVASATELAQANRQTAQEETAAVLENVLNAYKEAESQRQQAVTQEIQAESLNAEQAQAEAAQTQANATEAANWLNFYQQALANGDTAGASAAWKKLQTLFATDPTAAGTVGSAPVLESGVQEDGRLAFSTSDLNTKNAANIYAALEDAGYNFGVQQVINLNDAADYDSIKQTDFNSNKQQGEAAKYINAIKQAVNKGEINVGDVVQLNYGSTGLSRNYTYVYLGNGNFAKVSIHAGTDVSFYDNTNYGNNITVSTGVLKPSEIFKGQHKVFVPQGYKVDVVGGNIGTSHESTGTVTGGNTAYKLKIEKA